MKQSETYPETDISEKRQIRIPQILDLQLQGYTNQQIADALDISRISVWRDKKTDLYQYFVMGWLEKYEDKLGQLLEDDNKNTQLQVLKEIGTMIRGLKPKQIHQRTEKAEIKIVLHEYQPPPKNNPN